MPKDPDRFELLIDDTARTSAGRQKHLECEPINPVRMHILACDFAELAHYRFVESL
jgi:hypothetical protein